MYNSSSAIVSFVRHYEKRSEQTSYALHIKIIIVIIHIQFVWELYGENYFSCDHDHKNDSGDKLLGACVQMTCSVFRSAVFVLFSLFWIR